MYPGSSFKYHDESYYNTAPPVDLGTIAPLFMTAMAADKGTEDLIEIIGEDFNRMYGATNFSKYGQVSIQAQNLIDNGAALFVKRLVADDAELANVIITATVNSVQKTVQRRDDSGRPLYYTDSTETATTTTVTAYPVKDPVYVDADGNETTEATDTPKMIASIKWDAQSIEGANGSYKEACDVVDLAAKNLSSDNVFVLLPIKDNGRGASTKSVRFLPDYTTSKGMNTMLYTFTVYDNNIKTDDEHSVSLDPDVVYNGDAYRIDKRTNTQIFTQIDEAEYARMITYLADMIGVDESVVKTYDLMFGATNRGAILENIVIDSESIDLNASSGVALANGSNGIFADGPMKSDEGKEELWKQMIAFYDGSFTNEIYDVDQHKVSMILDADFPNEVKKAIQDLVSFRKDCMFFRDIGVGKKTFAEIFDALENLPAIDVEENNNATITNDTKSTDNTKFFSTYITSYEIADPQSKKYIEVTMLYDMASILPTILSDRPETPMAGTYNGFVLPNAIKGTLNFTPINTPNVNQRQAIEDLRCNYAIFEDDDLVVQSLYTCQPAGSQLDWSNNVLAMQYVVRKVRTACPRQRFALSDGSGLNDYATAVSKELEKYENMFDTLNFVYTENKQYSNQKIFNATIEFAFRNWAQSEYFDLFAISN